MNCATSCINVEEGGMTVLTTDILFVFEFQKCLLRNRMTEKIIKDASGNILRTYIVDGNNVPAFYLSARQIQDIVLALPNMFCRKDDLMLCTYPKTGLLIT